ncbi:MAG: hypothetical protein U1F54_22180 [Burkholderiales bacterium]
MYIRVDARLLPVPRAMAARGAHVLCAGSRCARNDTALIMEKVVLDFGAYVRHAKEAWGYERIVLAGWSGGGSLSLLYQAEAEQPTITHTPAGNPVDLVHANLIPADALTFQAAHVSRAVMLAEIDPSVQDEDDPEDRDVELDLYDPRNPNKPPSPASTSRASARRSSRACAGAPRGSRPRSTGPAAEGRPRNGPRLRDPSHAGRSAVPRSRDRSE